LQTGNIPRPNKHLFDINLPFYKKDDPTQAGEGGKAVKIDKEVCFIFPINQNCTLVEKNYDQSMSYTDIHIIKILLTSLIGLEAFCGR
jgi:hypothetical protein